MQHEPEDTDPTTQREPDDDVEAHNWAGKPPIVDDMEAHIMKQSSGPSEPDEEADDIDGNSGT